MSADTCPICSEPQLISVQSGVLKCQYCHAQIINGRLICPSCKRANNIGLEQCSVCGEPLTVVGAVIIRQTTGFGSHRLEQLKAQASDMKAHAEKHSQERMTVFKDVDQRRIQSERKAASQQELRDRTVLKYTAIGAVAFLFLVAIISLIILI